MGMQATMLGFYKQIAGVTRRKRFEKFKSLIISLPRPVRILDVGGTQHFWQQIGLCEEDGIEITLLNLRKEPVSFQNFFSTIGDARDLSQYKNKEFDVVFSNSVIEHVGDYSDQQKMANEIIRVAKRYILQTPNRYFPIEPHFIFPFFQFLPLGIQLWIVTHFAIGCFNKMPDRQMALKEIEGIRLLNEKEMQGLFPHANFFYEKFLWLTKSFIVYDGWEII